MTQTAAASSGATSSSRKAHLFVFGGAFCISFAALFVKDAAIASSVSAFYRLAFGGVALLLAALVRGERLAPSRGALLVMIPAGLLFCADLVAWHASIVRIGPGPATIVANFQVFFMAAYGAFFLGEYISLRHKIAMPLAILGLCMILEANPANLPPQTAAGVGFGLATAVFYTAYILTVRQSRLTSERLEPVAGMAWISFFAATAAAAFCGAQGLSFAIPDVRTGLNLAVLGIFCQAFGWVLFSLGLPHLPPSRAGLIMLFQPALSFIWDIVLCGRVTGAVGYLGAVVAILAIRLGLGGPAKQKTP